MPVLPENPDTIAWPMGNVVSDSLPPGINLPKLNQAVSQVMSDTIPFEGTFALMVVYKGQPVAEVYRHDFSEKTRFLSWSMAKSFTNTLIGIRVQQGALDINRPLSFASWTVGKPKMISVITSYSIHYTKLYESRPGESGAGNNRLFGRGSG